MLIVEGLAHLEKIQSEQVFFSALPLRIKGRDGSPCRAIALDGLGAAELAALSGIQS